MSIVDFKQSEKIGCRDTFFFKCHRRHWIFDDPNKPTQMYERVFLTWHNELHRKQ